MVQGIKFLHSLFEVAHVEFQTYDLTDHKLIFSTGVVRQLLGYPEDEFYSMSNDFYKNIIYPDDYAKVQETMARIRRAKKGEVFEMTVRARRIDGNYIWVRSRQMIYERSAKGTKCIIIREVEDVTELIELQDELKRKVAQLKEVSYKNSHLLRSPVASIIGLVDLIEEHGIASDHNKEILHFLKESIRKLDDVIHEINDTARLE